METPAQNESSNRLVLNPRVEEQTGFGSGCTTFILNLPISSPLLTAVLATQVKFVKNRIPDPFFTPPMQLHLQLVSTPAKTVF